MEETSGPPVCVVLRSHLPPRALSLTRPAKAEAEGTPHAALVERFASASEASMLFSEPFLFVLAISCVLCIPLGVESTHRFNQGGHHGDRRSVNGKELGED